MSEKGDSQQVSMLKGLLHNARRELASGRKAYADQHAEIDRLSARNYALRCLVREVVDGYEAEEPSDEGDDFAWPDWYMRATAALTPTPQEDDG